MRKNKFLTFMFSMIPGCGHMYLGYMKRGAEFMAMFAASSYLAFIFIGQYAFRALEGIGVIFAILLPIIWFYQMFDAMHTISQMRRLEIEYPEDDGFFIPGISNVTNLNSLNFFKKRGVIKIIAGVLICVGVYVLFLNMSDGIYRILSNITRNARTQEVYRQVYNVIMNYVPSVVISLVLIFGGIKLLAGNNKNNGNNENGGE